jgi:hypothetical protein
MTLATGCRTALLLALLALAGCRHVSAGAAHDGGADDDEDDTGSVSTFEYDAVDAVVVVDNSESMHEEQAILSTAVFSLFNTLVDPLLGGLADSVDDLRVAVVSTDMGLQWGGHPYATGDGWPEAIPLPCGAVGDDGAFRSYADGKEIDLASGQIPCDASGDQCPSGWSCEDLVDGIGSCVAPGGDGSDQECPPLDAEQSFSQTTNADPNPDLSFQVACLAALGTDGCGFEQQLEAAVSSIERPDQHDLLRPNALLFVLIVSDEEDCSLENGPGLFASSEVQDEGQIRVNLACGENPEHLYAPSVYYQRLVQLKSGHEDAVLFAAIVGVPPVAACEGSGDEIGGCLDHEDMQLEEQLEPTYDMTAWFYRPACTRYEGELEVVKARPGRRYVSLAQQFGPQGYVYSICNEDWGEAVEDLADLIVEKIK